MSHYLDEILDLSGRGLPQADLARTLEARAHESEPGSEEHSGFFNAAGDHWSYAEEPARAEAAYRSSIAGGGDPGRYAHAALVLLLLGTGRDAEADELLASLLALARVDELSTVTYEMVAEALEDSGRLREAQRWFTMPLRDVDPEDLDEDDGALLEGRYRVRRALALPLDRFDLERDRLSREQP